MGGHAKCLRLMTRGGEGGQKSPKHAYVIHGCSLIVSEFPDEILDFGSQCIALACQTDRNGFVSSLGLTQCVCKIYSCSGHL